MNKYKLIIALLLFALYSSLSAGQGISSRNVPNEKRAEMLGNHIMIKSAIEWTEFQLYGVNEKFTSLPGDGNKDYKIIIKIKPENINLWLQGKDRWITSFPHSIDWIKDLLNETEYQKISQTGFITYYREGKRSKHIIWANNEKGILLIRYIEE